MGSEISKKDITRLGFSATLRPLMVSRFSPFSTIVRRLPAYLFPARRLDPRRLFSRREGDR